TYETKTADKPAVTYFAVPQGGAKPTEGYTAAVWLEPGSTDTATRVTFGQKKSGKEVDISGRVAAASADGKRVTVEVGSKKKGEDQKIDIQLTPKTSITFSSVQKNGARPAEGQSVQISLVPGSKDVAATANFSGEKD